MRRRPMPSITNAMAGEMDTPPPPRTLVWVDAPYGVTHTVSQVGPAYTTARLRAAVVAAAAATGLHLTGAAVEVTDLSAVSGPWTAGPVWGFVGFGAVHRIYYHSV